MDKVSWLLFWTSIACSAVSIFYGLKIDHEKEYRIFHVTGLILAILLIVKNSF